MLQHMHEPVRLEDAAEIIGRLERIPYGPWHRKARAIIGAATFFDGLDLLAVAYVVPLLAPLWGLNPQKIGLLISSGFLGQLVGALLFRVGRRKSRTNASDGLVDCAVFYSKPCLRGILEFVNLSLSSAFSRVSG